MQRPVLASRLRGFGTTIFAEMTALAARTGALNLGQGFPDTDGPAAVLDVAAAAVRSGSGFNQYPPGLGLPELRQAIASHQQRFYGLSFDPDREVLVTAGATEAIAASLLALLDPGDEVVAFEPFYDSYAACISMAGAVRKPVTLRTPDFALDVNRLRAAFTDRTRLVLLNSPHNPTGKVFTRAELDEIARLAIERDVLVITDEVYEHLVFDGEHIPLATLPGMRDRTVTISSGGKTFSVTGWKIGWVCAVPELLDAVKTAKQFLTYVSGGPFQPAIAAGLRLPDGYFSDYTADMRTKRDRLCDGLEQVGFGVYRPQGTFFVTADIRPLGETDGMAFCRALPERCGIVAIPSVVFYDDVEEGRPLVRFACCKRHEVIDDAVVRLKGLRGMKIAAIQHDIVWEDPKANFEHLAPMIAAAAGAGARLAVLTEMYATGFSMEAERVAEPEGGPASTFLAEQATAHDIWLYASVAELPRSGGLPRNVGVLCAPDGRQHRYAKIHPFTYAREHEIYDAGTDMVTVDVEGLRVSLFVCYDLRFADEFWMLAPETDCYLVCANWPESRRHAWRSLLVARAIENEAYVIGVNRVGVGGKLVYAGDSAIIDPLGETLASGSRTEAILVADVDPAVVTSVRDRFPFLRDRRTYPLP